MHGQFLNFFSNHCSLTDRPSKLLTDRQIQRIKRQLCYHKEIRLQLNQDVNKPLSTATYIYLLNGMTTCQVFQDFEKNVIQRNSGYCKKINVKHIGSVVSEILLFIQPDRQTNRQTSRQANIQSSSYFFYIDIRQEFR